MEFEGWNMLGWCLWVDLIKLVSMTIHLSIKSVSDLNETCNVGRGTCTWVLHDGMPFDSVQSQRHRGVKCSQNYYCQQILKWIKPKPGLRVLYATRPGDWWGLLGRLARRYRLSCRVHLCDKSLPVLIVDYTIKVSTLRSVCARWCFAGRVRTYIRPSGWRWMASWWTCLLSKASSSSIYSGLPLFS